MMNSLSTAAGHANADPDTTPASGKMKGWTTRGKKWLLPLVVFAMVEIMVLAGLFLRPEMALYDAWFRLRGDRDPGDRVVIVAMDDASIHSIGPLAWPRSVHAGLLENLGQAGVVGFDLVFDVPTAPGEDEAFARAIANHGRVVLASQFSFEKEAGGGVTQVLQIPSGELMTGAAALGFVNTPRDDDGVVRRITAVDVNTFAIPFPSLGLAVAMEAAGLRPEDLKLDRGRLTAGDRVVPVDRINRALLNFWGPQAAFKTYSYKDIYNGDIKPGEFKDKIVLIGPTSAASKDTFPTPFTTSNLILSGALESPGVEIHASVVQSFLENRWYRQAPSPANHAFLLLTGVLTTLAVAGRGPWLGLAGALAVVGLALATAFGLWFYGSLWINGAAPVVLAVFTYVVVTAADFVRAEMGRRRTRAMFGRYVSPAVVEELMKDPGDVALGGNRRTITVMFCDIRGFTAYSENKEPEQVVRRLNEYLTVLTGVIFRHGGTLDKYLGDGLMALFGAPVPYPDHVQRAIRAAVEMQEEVAKLNRVWVDRGEPSLNIGVGINSGSVLVGNVGSPERMDYTVIGEDVNLASRVEGLTKNYNTMIVISERSVHMLGDKGELPWNLTYLGHAEVKGFSVPVGVYTVER